jgi:hypothetical protein
MSISLTAAMADPKLPGGQFQSEIRYTHAPVKKNPRTKRFVQVRPKGYSATG